MALTAGSEASLPACCRRNGAHHCAGTMQSAQSPASGIHLSPVPQHCPAYPAVVTQIRHGDLSYNHAALTFAEIVSHPAIKLQTEARARVSLDRASQKRGPPTELL
jgi:hypothetical protein